MKDRWFRLDLNERERLIRENAEQITMLENLSYSGTSAAADKLLAANVWKKMGLFNNFVAIRAAMFEAERRRRPGRKPDAGEIYRAIATEFKAGKWANHTNLMALVKEKDEADCAASQERLVASLLASIRARGMKRALSLEEEVNWVSEHLLYDLESLEAGKVPSAGALSLWIWAKAHETNFRRMYDAKQMPRGALLNKRRGTFGHDDRATQEMIESHLKGWERAAGNEGVV